LSAKFHSAVIHSQRRFAYPEVLAILQRPPGDDPIEQMLHQAHELAQKIRRLRFKAGSLELDFPETKIRLDEQGKILRIERTENDVSHQLIEECMLLANEAVAAQLMSRRLPAIYRIHEEPDARRLEDYRREVLAHHLPCGNLRQPAEVQKLLRKLGTLPIGPALKIGFLKSLMRARYAVEPLGHYGLAKKKYTHFTSPIRRYADLTVHRALFDKPPAPAAALQEIAEHISVTERNSADAERDSKDVKMYAFLLAQLDSGAPPNYPALVTDVRNIGFFVEVPGLAMSGLVPLSLMEDDFYVFDENRRLLVGRRTRRTIQLGDPLTVQVARVDRFKKQVDFRLAGVPRKPSAPRSPGIGLLIGVPKRSGHPSRPGRRARDRARSRSVPRDPDPSVRGRRRAAPSRNVRRTPVRSAGVPRGRVRMRTAGRHRARIQPRRRRPAGRCSMPPPRNCPSTNGRC
jgi:ribonuclease R